MIRCRGSYQGQGFVVVVVCSCVRVCECEDSCDGQGSLFEIVADNFFLFVDTRSSFTEVCGYVKHDGKGYLWLV